MLNAVLGNNSMLLIFNCSYKFSATVPMKYYSSQHLYHNHQIILAGIILYTFTYVTVGICKCTGYVEWLCNKCS